MAHLKTAIYTVCILGITTVSIAQPTINSDAVSSYTQALNQHYQEMLPFSNQEDFVSAQKGFIGQPKQLIIKNSNDKIIWNFTAFPVFEALTAHTPATVNPSLWRQAQLNAIYGLFEVTDGIYQVRGYDISNMTIIRGKTGYIVVDPLISEETAKAALALFFQHFPKKPIVAVIYTHSHIDHFGGVKGVVSEHEVQAGKVKIIAPKRFMKEAISENVLAGTAMSRRAQFMYGMFLPTNAEGLVDVGIGKGTSKGTSTLIPPTKIIKKTGEELTIDGVKFVFQYTPDTEAPAEMNFYLPDFKALCMAENAIHSMHNLYTLRGAQVRDAKSWSAYLNQTIQMFAKNTNVIFASHTWPVWGNEQDISFLEKQRDLYKYIHDQTLRLANEGYTMNEIAEMVQLPPSLANEWYDRGYYGTVSHNVKAVYQRYLGWYDGNPAHLNPLPPVEECKKIVEYMGGADAIMAKAQQDYAQGNYRWVAEVMNYVVFADPSNQAAKELEAKAFQQLGYQSESAPWRNIYLTGSQELRRGTPVIGNVATASPDIIRSMTPGMMFDYLSIRLNGPKAEGKVITLNMIFPDVHQKYKLQLKNSVLNYFKDQQDPNADATVIIDRHTLDNLILGKATIKDDIVQQRIKVTGNPAAFKELFSLMDKFDMAFNVVTP